MFAVLLLKTGMARRALQRALSGDVITPIYFHKPSRKLFEGSISWLIRNGYTLISVDELVDVLRKRRPFPKGAAWISLDDGYREWLDELLPVIEKHKVPVTLFIPSGIIAGDGMFPWMQGAKRENGSGQTPDRRSLTVEELKRIAKSPYVRIGGHTVNHALTVNCTNDQLLFEIRESKRDLESWTSTTVCSFSYPEGRYDGRERRALAACEYAVATTTVPSFIRRDTDPMLVPRFCVPDDVTLSEAICNMVGIWRPFLEPIKTLINVGGIPENTSTAAAVAGSETVDTKPKKHVSKEEPIDVV